MLGNGDRMINGTTISSFNRTDDDDDDDDVVCVLVLMVGLEAPVHPVNPSIKLQL